MAPAAPQESPQGVSRRTLDADGLIRNRPAFFAGLGGLSLAAVLAYAVATGVASADDDEREAADDDTFELEFSPGTIARLGAPLDPSKKNVIADRRAPDPVPDDPATAAVSVDDRSLARATPSEPKPPTPPVKPDHRDPRIPTSSKPTHANTPHDDPPTVDHDIGVPFGTAEGWSDLVRSGDPWATAVMSALAQMEVGAFAGDIGDGDFQFQLTICKDGKIDRVLDKGGTLPDADQGKVMLALESLELPKPTADIAKSMPTECVRLKYTFAWSRDGVK